MNNPSCTSACAQALTNYIGQEGVTIEEGDQGYYNGQVLTPTYMSDLQNEFGGVSEFEALIQDMLPADGAVAGDGEDSQ